jgi:hypothetical protein
MDLTRRHRSYLGGSQREEIKENTPAREPYYARGYEGRDASRGTRALKGTGVRSADLQVGKSFRSQESGVRRQESGDRRQESGDRRQETGVRRQETGDRRQESGDRRQETGDRSQETGDRRQETGTGRKNSSKSKTCPS